MKGSNSKKSVKKQAGKDPWGAQGRKRREAEMARANAKKRTEQAKAGKAKATPSAARDKQEGRGRSRSPQPQPETSRGSHARKTRNEAENPRRKILVGLLVLMALLIVGYILSGPITRNIDASSEIKAKQLEAEKEHAKTEDLNVRKAQANDIKYLEEEARRIGYVLPGEIPVIVVEEGQPASSGDDAQQSPDNSTTNSNP